MVNDLFGKTNTKEKSIKRDRKASKRIEKHQKG
jgi:hypothetical protein